MKVVAAYLLARLGGKEKPKAEDLKKILGSVGADINDGKIELLLDLVEDRDITELIAVGKEKFASFSSAGSAAVAVASVEVSNSGAAAPVGAKKEEKEEIKEESDEDMCFSLFD